MGDALDIDDDEAFETTDYDDMFSTLSTDDGSIDDTEDMATTSDDSHSIDDTDSGDLDTTANTSSGDSNDEEDDSQDNTESNDDSNTDTDSEETNTDTNDDSTDVVVEEEEDVCDGLVESDCDDVTDDTGDMECAYNAVSGDCYSIERRQGRFGAGNFDDGFIAAQEEAKKDNAGLYAIIGVSGGVVGIMLIVIAFGGYYLYSQSNKSHAPVVSTELTDMANGQTINIDDDAQNLMGDQVTRS